MSRRWRGFWVVLGVLLGIPAAAAAVLYVYSWFAPDTAKLRVFVKKAQLQIPSAYREYLHAVDASPRKTLVEIADAAAPTLHDNRSFESERELTPMRAFAESSPIIFRFHDPDIFTVKIANVGQRIANNVKVFLPSEGFVEVTKDSAVVDSAQHKGWVELGALEPGSEFLVTMWTTGGYLGENVRVNSDREGAANVRQWYVSREENRWVIGFGLTEVVFFFYMALVVALFSLGLLVNAMQSRAKAVQQPDDTKGTSA